MNFLKTVLLLATVLSFGALSKTYAAKPQNSSLNPGEILIRGNKPNDQHVLRISTDQEKRLYFERCTEKSPLESPQFSSCIRLGHPNQPGITVDEFKNRMLNYSPSQGLKALNASLGPVC